MQLMQSQHDISVLALNHAWPLLELETVNDAETQTAIEKTQRLTCKLDTVEDTFTHQQRLISLIYLLCTFVLADTFLSYSLAKHGKGKPFFPPMLSGWKEATARNLHITSQQLAAAVSEQ